MTNKLKKEGVENPLLYIDVEKEEAVK